MALPLSGVKVVDLCQQLAGPFTSTLLADQGAEVIKVEPPEGDSFRRATPNFPNAPGMSYDFISVNRNKRSIVVDIAKPLGLTVARRLFQWADVAVINMRQSARRRRSLMYEDVAAINPRLIYVSVTGYGEKGPEADLPGADVAMQPRVGDVAARRLPGGAMPGPTRLIHFDVATSMLGAYAIMLALWERERTGLGQKIETALLRTALVCQVGQMTRFVGNMNEGRPMRGDRGTAVYECSDGRFIYAPTGREEWGNFCAAMALRELARDERFDTPQKRTQKAEELRKILAAQFSTRPALEWETRLKAQGFGVSVLKDVLEVFEDPQVLANQMIIEFQQPGIGVIKAVNVPFELSSSADEPTVRRHVPYIGEHTMEVLKELGYTDQEIETFRKADAVG